jgi:hypothetical protein
MSIEVPEKVVNVLGSGSISIPFSDIEAKKGFIGMCLRFVNKVFEVGIKVADEVLIEILSK